MSKVDWKSPINLQKDITLEIDRDKMDEALDSIIKGNSIRKVAMFLGFKSLNKFSKFLLDNPAVLAEIENARVQACMHLEDELLSVADDYGKDVARTKMDCIAKLLKFRDPKRYGDKLDMSVTHTIDISGSLLRAEQRVIDVIPIQNVLPIKK